MSNHSINLTEKVYQYLLRNTLREHGVLKELHDETADHRWATMQISPEHGQFMALMVQILAAKNIIELGVFTGYSSLCMALALPEDGRIIACDVKEEYTNIAEQFWDKAGVSDKIDLRLAPALDTLDALISEQRVGEFDMVFIDAVKEEYLQYYESVLVLLRTGGVMFVDNVLWGGAVADENNSTAETLALRKFNTFVHQDERVDISMIPLGDGLTLIRKR